MRISDWSSDVCSSDLRRGHRQAALRYVWQAGAGGVYRGRGARRQSIFLMSSVTRAESARRIEQLRTIIERHNHDYYGLDEGRKSVVQGTSGSVRVDLGGGRSLKKKKTDKDNKE